MKSNAKKFVLLAGLVAALAVAYAMGPMSQDVSAAPTGVPVATTITPALNTPFTVTAGWSDEGSATAVFTATKSAGVTGNIVASSCVLTGSNTDTPSTPVVAAGTPSDTCTITDDLDTLVEATTMSLSYTCATAGTVSFSVTQGGITSTPATVVTCGGTTAGQIIISFANGAACGPVQLQAYVIGTNGLPVPDQTQVSFFSPQGTINPAQASTAGGYAYAVFTPTVAFTTATVSATAAGATGQGILQNTCNASVPGYVAPAVPQPVVQQPVVQQPVTQPVTQLPPAFVAPPQGLIAPPNTGDAGLKADD